MLETTSAARQNELKHDELPGKRIATIDNGGKGGWGGDARAEQDQARGPGNSGNEWKQTSHGRSKRQRVTEKVRLRRWKMLDG